jgi:hypothetical protein
MGKPLVRFCEGLGYNHDQGRNTVAPPRKQAETEKTNIDLQSWESPAYSKVRINEKTYSYTYSYT